MKRTAWERIRDQIFGRKPTTTTTTTPRPTPTTTTTSAPTQADPRDKLVTWAKAQVGKPYATYRDCSGFTAAAYRQIGITIPEGSVAQWGVGLNATGPWQPGDLIFWDTFGPAPGHVALYVGNNKVIHALNEQRGIVESDINANMGGPLMGGRRLLQTNPVYVPPTVSTVSANSDFRNLPHLTENQVCAILAGTPMAEECGAIWRASKGDPLPVAQSYMESRYGEDANAKKARNALGLMDYSGKNPTLNININGHILPLRKFNTWAEGFAEWRRRVDDLSYPGGGG